MPLHKTLNLDPFWCVAALPRNVVSFVDLIFLSSNQSYVVARIHEKSARFCQIEGGVFLERAGVKVVGHKVAGDGQAELRDVDVTSFRNVDIM